MKNFVILFFICIMAACNSNTNNNKIKTEIIDTNVSDYDTIRAKVIELEIGWGYEISINNKTYIRQTIIPAIEGNYTFGSPEDAQKIANLVGTKIMNDFMPPSVTIKELDSLGVLTNKLLK